MRTLPSVRSWCYSGTTMVTRMQVTLDDEEHRRAKARAAAAGVSLAQYIRQLVAADGASGVEPPRPAIEDVFDLGDSGGSDVSRHKDDYLGQAVEANQQRHRS